ncbi:VWA domain-containing protein [Brevibacillus antibioticus]|uniref:VWA domain-containing protein n=1 Tax=Brevibacillus antibioticus TaxID=2570228 RepID=A0A4U2Y6M7_9BACL|nr:VWA domain-containing protein [Brevibacillus antibioticus]TKI55452.1 VWA domain-containing protein [Brevibacillus antibioticus]
MSIDLKKKAEENFISLKKKADEAVSKVGLNGQTARVALAIDISGSMSALYRNGVVQRTVERLLALGVKFDDNRSIDIFLFGNNDYEVGELSERDFFNYVNDHIVRKYQLEGYTNYAGVMKRIAKKYYPQAFEGSATSGGFFGKLFGGSQKFSIDQNAYKARYQDSEPVYVYFLTDGDNGDKSETELVIREASKLGIFWQFVGIGNERFQFLSKLDNLPGRFIDNANFFTCTDLNQISDEELFKRSLAEFPSYLTEARSKGLIK